MVVSGDDPEMDVPNVIPPREGLAVRDRLGLTWKPHDQIMINTEVRLGWYDWLAILFGHVVVVRTVIWVEAAGRQIADPELGRAFTRPARRR